MSVSATEMRDELQEAICAKLEDRLLVDNKIVATTSCSDLPTSLFITLETGELFQIDITRISTTHTVS